jgi:4-amino-4-deoxy-L-arabinose transferase-like glycosyltransferase
VAAAGWAERARPRSLVVAAALIAASVLLDYWDRQLPLAVRFLVALLLVAFYVLPWLVAIVRSFTAGYRGHEDPA